MLREKWWQRIPRRAWSSIRSTATMSLVFPHTFVPWFRTVAPYIHAYHGKTFVVAIAGELIAAGKLQRRSRRTWRSCTRWASSWCSCTAFGRR